MVSSEDVIHLYQLFLDNHIQVWLTGGWGIDALLGEQTRPHKDLDVIMLVDDVRWMRTLLEGEGYGLKELWEENHADVDAQGNEIATAFVLRDAAGREIDAHAMRLDERGYGIPAWEADEGFLFRKEDLAGEGAVAWCIVRCLAAQMQMVCHRGYILPEKQVGDLARLREKFGVELT